MDFQTSICLAATSYQCDFLIHTKYHCLQEPFLSAVHKILLLLLGINPNRLVWSKA